MENSVPERLIILVSFECLVSLFDKNRVLIVSFNEITLCQHYIVVQLCFVKA